MLEKHLNDFPFYMFGPGFCVLWLKDYVHTILHHLVYEFSSTTAILSEYCLSS